MTEREKIAAKIRALRAKTVENGCTEAEAIAAAEKVAKLLADHNLTLDEADLRGTPFEQHGEGHEDDVGKRLWKPASAIAALTGAKHWVSAPGVFPVEQHFFGFAHEVDVARYLLEICARAMRTERDRLVRASGRMRPAQLRNLVNPFLDGMADRLRERILAMRPPPPPPGTGLVVVRGALIAEALAAAGLEFEPTTLRTGQRGGEEYERGRAAAAAVALNPGLAAQAGAARIGGHA